MEIFGFICLIAIGAAFAIFGIFRFWITLAIANSIDYIGGFFIIAGLYVIVWGIINSPIKIVMENETQRISVQ